MLFPTAKRDARRILLVEFNPHQILVATLTQQRGGRTAVEAAAEFDRDDLAGFREWLARDENATRGRLVLCSLVPLRGIVQRESIEPGLLDQPGYLENLVEEQQKGRFLTATPFKVVKAGVWTFRTLKPHDGTPLQPADPAQPALICALANSEVLEVQRELLDQGALRDRLEPGLLSLFGAVYRELHRRGDLRAVVVVVVLESVTAVYILGKEGVHTPNPVLHGLNSIVELGRKELGVATDEEVLSQLGTHDPVTARQAGKLVRRIGRDLKPVIDSFEMTTGQPVEEVFCAYLPAKLSQLAEPLAQSTGRQLFALDLAQALPALQPPEGVVFGPRWLGALDIALSLPDSLAAKGRQGKRGPAAYQRPWHVDSSLPMKSTAAEAAGRRVVLTLAASLAGALLLAATGWQLYALDSLEADTRFWQTQLSSNRRLFDQLTTANAALKQQSAVLDRAYELMAEPFQLSDLLVNLGRTVPPRMRIARIDSNDTRVAVSGSLMEPAEEASATLGRYMEELRRDPAVGPLFSNIAITTLQRKSNTENEVMFELTLRLKRSTP